MKITVFTSNQPRHLALIASLAQVGDEVHAVQECTTIFPGDVADFYQKSEVMQRYFKRTLAAEREIFGGPSFSRKNTRSLAVKMGDLSRMQEDELKPALSSDIYIVFGASYIKGNLCDFLVKRRAINIHMGVSPFYRGTATNFWALYDRRPEYVGATLHLLSAGLDSGAILYHALPAAGPSDPFLLGMQAVRAAQVALIEKIQTGEILSVEPALQDPKREIRYSRNKDFCDQIAEEYLGRVASPGTIEEALRKRNPEEFVRPVIC